MDARIILGAQQPDLIGSLARGVETGGVLQAARQQNRLADLYSQQGAAILGGEQNALAALAGIDPAQAIQIQQSQQQGARQQQAHDLDMRATQQRMSVLSAQEERAAAQYAAQVGEAQAAAEAQQIEEAVRMGMAIPDAATWDQVMSQQQPELVGMFDQREMLANRFMSMADIMKRAGGAGATEYGLQPQFGMDAEGNPVMLQVGKDGTATQTRMPDGVSLSREPIKLDAGTHFVLLDPVTRQPVGQVPKELRAAAAETAAGKAQGEAQGEAIAGLGQTIAKAQDAMTLIDSVIGDPALESITGNFQGRLPAGIPGMTGGQAGANLGVKIEQLQGKAFLEAFESLKGGGQITEVEGIKATQAIARLQRAQDANEYRVALKELRDIAERGVERARKAAGSAADAATPSAQNGAPQPGMVEDGYRFLGGDPSYRENWEKVE